MAQFGGAVYISALPQKASAIDISKSNFTANTATNGAAIYVDKGFVNIKSSTFGDMLDSAHGNSASNYGGAIYNNKVDVDSEYTSLNYTKITSSKFYSNSAELGGAIYNIGQLTLNKNSFGAKYKKTDTNYFNLATLGGAIYNTGNMLDSASTYSYNLASENGGAIYNTGDIRTYNKKGALTGGLNSDKFIENSAKIGGAIYNIGYLALSKNTFDGNTFC